MQDQQRPSKNRAQRNKTLELSPAESIKYSSKLLHTENLQNLSSIESILNKIVLSDLYDVLDLLPASFADLIILDPPYNLSKDFHGVKFKSMKIEAYIDYLRTWFPRVVRTLKPGGSLYICGDWRSTAAQQIVVAENLEIINRITWQREKGRGAKFNWKNSMEDIWFAVNDKDNYYFDVEAVKLKRRVIAPYRVDGLPKNWEDGPEGKFRLTYPSNFWDDISIPYWSMAENTRHPTQKPEKLLAKLVLASSRVGDVVFDPFLGSGSSAVVAKKLGRQYLGIDYNEEYAVWAEKRLDLAEQDKRIQGYINGVFWERNTSGAQKRRQ